MKTEAGGLCFTQNYEKYKSFFLSETFSNFGSEIFYIFERACFRNGPLKDIKQTRKKEDLQNWQKLFLSPSKKVSSNRKECVPLGSIVFCFFYFRVDFLQKWLDEGKQEIIKKIYAFWLVTKGG